MGIEPAFPKGAVAGQVLAFQERVEEATIYMLKYLGEELAAYAKDLHSYTDRTGNLTNSIGYAVVRRGTIITRGGGAAPGEGDDAALKAATAYARTLDGTFSLIVVAGMNYAAYVEAKGYNVILPAELRAKTEVPKAVNLIVERAKAKARKMFGDVGL